MEDRDKRRFAGLLAAAAEVVDKKLSDAKLKIYWAALKDLKIEEVERAINLHLNDPVEGRFMVKPADIRRHVQGLPEDRALRAWSELEAAIEKHGAYASVVFADPILSRVVSEMGGWVRLCGEDLNSYLRHEFTKRYEALARSGGPDTAPVKHLGLVERTNRANGYDSQPDILQLVGDQEKAQKRLEGSREGYDGREGAKRFLAEVERRSNGQNRDHAAAPVTESNAQDALGKAFPD